MSGEGDLIRIVFPDMPPSANDLRKSFVKAGRVMSAKTERYAAWREAAVWEIAAQRPGRIEGPYVLAIAVQRNWRSKRARDVDNIIKPISDALVKAGVVEDDSLAEKVSAQWADDLPDGVAAIASIGRVSS
ncbi:RusA family crossover junction endodeoxyribonuclease [Stappia sp.]|uniref:RusA family crossover junction endodeoxyribonuclease n=1 Tax=Stappia sp. TaxID=1870903 RepID=UPI003C7E1EA2